MCFECVLCFVIGLCGFRGVEAVARSPRLAPCRHPTTHAPLPSTQPPPLHQLAPSPHCNPTPAPPCSCSPPPPPPPRCISGTTSARPTRAWGRLKISNTTRGSRRRSRRRRRRRRRGSCWILNCFLNLFLNLFFEFWIFESVLIAPFVCVHRPSRRPKQVRENSSPQSPPNKHAHRNSSHPVTIGSPARRGGRAITSLSGRLKPNAVAGSPSVTRLTHSSWTGVSTSGTPKAAATKIATTCEFEFF